MAIKTTFEGWVNDIKPTEWGAYMTIAHDQRAKNEQTGEWETVGKDWIDVSVPANLLPGFEGAKVVSVTGNAKVEAYLAKDGTPKARLKVRASEVTPIERGNRVEPGPAPVDENLPF